jgi:hypothetical protein
VIRAYFDRLVAAQQDEESPIPKKAAGRAQGREGARHESPQRQAREVLPREEKTARRPRALSPMPQKMALVLHGDDSVLVAQGGLLDSVKEALSEAEFEGEEPGDSG